MASHAAPRTVLANGVRFAVLEQGEGPLVLLLHGFPDTAHTWSHQMPRLAAAGYRAVAPFLRGYPPTEIPAAGYYDAATLACDVKGLIDALADGPAHVVAQDWGAAIAYGVLAAFPASVRRAVTMAIPHPRVRPLLIASPEQIHRSFHWWFFQLANLPELAIRLNDFAFIDYLWRLWSPRLDDPAHVADVKRMLAIPGALEATLSYYRAMLDPTRADPELASVRRDLDRDITVPTLTLFGADDMRADFADAQKAFFAGPYRSVIVPGCGHFLHREKPDEVTDLVLDWLGRDDTRA